MSLRALLGNYKPSVVSGFKAFNPEKLSTVALIIDKFGHLSARELAEISHMEKANTKTITGELISYEYALKLSF